MAAWTGLCIRYHRWFKSETSRLGLRTDFYSTDNLISLPAHVSWVLAEDRRITGQKKKGLLTHSIESCVSVSIFMPVPSVPKPHGGLWHGSGGFCACGGFALHLSSISEHQESTAFIASSKHTFSLGINIVSFPKVIRCINIPERWFK